MVEDADRGVDETAAPPETPGAGWGLESPGPHNEPAPELDEAALTLVADLPIVERSEYEIEGELARGGLGRVLVARSRRLGRTVAIKELRADRVAAVGRFVREAMITSRLQHPSIVPVYEAGRWPGGLPFYAMKLVTGHSLADRIEAGHDLADRLALLSNLTAVTDAMSYAHANGVIHRDLKPSNVMVGDFRDTVVVDWGLGKYLDDADVDVVDAGVDVVGADIDVVDTIIDVVDAGVDRAREGHTRLGAVMGTPGYMAPEQARGESVDQRADVYALGAVLFSILTGDPPRDGEPVTGVELERRAPQAPAELIAITTRAMNPDPAARYPSARELADDLHRYQTGRLVSAHRYSVATLVWRWMRRHRTVVASVTVALAVLVVVGGLSIQRIVQARERAEQLSASLAARNEQLIIKHAQAILDRDPTATLAWLKQATSTATLPDRARLAADAISRGIASDALRGQDGDVWALAVDRTSQRVATVGKGGIVSVWDLRTGETAVSPDLDVRLAGLSWSDDGQRIATCGVRGVHVWEPASSDVYSMPTRDLCRTVAISPNGELVVSGHNSGDVRQWWPDRDEHTRRADHEGLVYFASISPDGQWSATAADDGVIVRQLSDDAVVVRDPGPGGHALAWSPDSALLVSTAEDGGVRAIRIADRAVQRFPLVPSDEPMWIALSADGRRAATGDLNDRRVRLWDLSTGALTLLEGHTGGVRAGAFTTDGDVLATASTDGTARLWDLASGSARIFRGHDGAVTTLGFDARGRLITGGLDGAVRVWDTAPAEAWVRSDIDVAAVASTTELVVGLRGDGIPVTIADADNSEAPRFPFADTVASAITTDGRFYAVSSREGAVWVWEVGTTNVTVLRDAPTRHSLVHISNDGEWVVVNSWNSGDVHVWNRTTTELRRFGGHGQYAFATSLSTNGRVIVSSGVGAIRWTDVASGSSETVYEGVLPIHAVAVSHDGRRFAWGDLEGRVWHGERGQPQQQFSRHSGRVWKLAMSPDGMVVVSGGNDGVAVRSSFDGATVQRLLVGQPVSALRVSAAGVVAVGTSDGTVFVWDPEVTTPRILRGHTGTIYHLAFIGDTDVVSASDDGTVRRWRDPLAQVPRADSQLRDWIDQLTSVAVDEAGIVATPPP